MFLGKKGFVLGGGCAGEAGYEGDREALQVGFGEEDLQKEKKEVLRRRVAPK